MRKRGPVSYYSSPRRSTTTSALPGATASAATSPSGETPFSQSSASMMTEALTGKTVEQAEKLTQEFRGMMAGEVEPDEEDFGDLIALKGVVKYPIRIKCAVLAWDVLQEALEGSNGEAAGSAPHSG